MSNLVKCQICPTKVPLSKISDDVKISAHRKHVICGLHPPPPPPPPQSKSWLRLWQQVSSFSLAIRSALLSIGSYFCFPQVPCSTSITIWVRNNMLVLGGLLIALMALQVIVCAMFQNVCGFKIIFNFLFYFWRIIMYHALIRFY